MSELGSASRELFDASRRRAFVQDVLAELGGRSGDLLSFEQVRHQLHLAEPRENATLQEIPLDRIVGSVGRYRDFTRAFLPRSHVSADRWMRIDRLHGKARLPPIDVFKVGDVYFVRDGNHRVSVARARRQKLIEAWVVDIPVRVPLGPETAPDSLILKAGYAEFLDRTSLDRACPDQNIEITRPGGYRDILKHVEVHQYYMGLRSRTYPTLEEAAEGWYRHVYLPLVERIRTSGILRHFPSRTEGDLYLWIAENQARLQMAYGRGEESAEAVSAFQQEHASRKLTSRVRRWAKGLLCRLGLPDRRTGAPSAER